MPASSLGLTVAERVAACNAESDTLAIIIKAQQEGLISKKVLADLTSPTSLEQSKAKRRMNLLNHVHATLQSRIEHFKMRISMLPASNVMFAGQAVRLIKKEEVGHLTALHAQVPILMRRRYLLVCVHATLTETLQNMEIRTSKIVPYKLDQESDPLEFAKRALRSGLIEEHVLFHLISCYPDKDTMKTQLLHHNYKKMKESMNNHIERAEFEMGRLMKPCNKLIICLDSFSEIAIFSFRV